MWEKEGWEEERESGVRREKGEVLNFITVCSYTCGW